MKIAYLIQAHKNRDQLCALIEYLIEDDDCCFVHIDAKSSLLFEELKNYFDGNKAVNILTEREAVYWGDLSQVKATLKLLKTVTDCQQTFDRICLMSGEDLPLMPPLEIKQFFADGYKDKLFISYETIGKFSWRLQRYNILTNFRFSRMLFIRVLQKLFVRAQQFLPQRKALRGYRLYKGSQWFSLSFDAVKYIVAFIEENSEYMDGFTFSSCADEHFFHIILLNSSFQESIVNNNLYYMNWDKQSSSPAYLTQEEFFRITRTGKYLFARKFDEATALAILEKASL